MIPTLPQSPLWTSKDRYRQITLQGAWSCHAPLSGLRLRKFFQLDHCETSNGARRGISDEAILTQAIVAVRSA